jgi:hypothetical protein
MVTFGISFRDSQQNEYTNTGSRALATDFIYSRYMLPPQMF